MRPLLTPLKLRLCNISKEKGIGAHACAHFVPDEQLAAGIWGYEAYQGAHTARFQRFAEQLFAAFGVRFTIMDVVSEVNYIKDHYSDFKRFKIVPGVKYDRRTEVDTIAHAYLMGRGTEPNFEMPMETYFRINGRPLT